LLLSWILVTLLVLVGRFIVRRFVYSLRQNDRFLTSVLIIGANEEGVAVAEQLHAAVTSGVWLAGFVDNDLPEGSELAGGYRVLGTLRNLVDIIQRHGIQEIIIAASSVSREQLLEIFQQYGTSNDVVLRLSSGLFEIMTTGMQVREIGSVPLMKLNKVRLTGIEVFLKSVLDYVLAFVGLILLSPLFVLIGLAIKFDSPGSMFHKRKVLGVGGKRFYAYKLRSMYVDADEILQENEELLKEYLVSYKLKDDPRITRVGRIIRRGSLDELPQLWNVLRGEMSLIGPRIITEEEHDRYGKWKLNLLTVKPGISGLWQVRGRSDFSYEERITLDMHYIRNYSIWLDLQILFQTLPKVLRRDGAY
jgi:exopolysaccharide biosynthesis polyprenyl glycosylphosphotransferase